MKRFLLRLFSATFGLFLFSLGVVLVIRANIGFSPWDVLHAGIAGTVGITIGAASILVGLLVLGIVVLCGEKLGFGTVLGMAAPGVFMDFILWTPFVPTMDGIISGSVMLLAGLAFISIGTFFYLKPALSAGPRDYLMISLSRKTKIPIGLCRSFFEFLATGIGWLLGGMVGLGTVMSVIGIGFFIQVTFKFFKFDAATVKHETFKETLASLRG